jgi:septal ring-binding cell division protein DamX
MTGQMLTYRSASFWTNQWNPGATLGIRSTDEIEDTVPVQTLTAPPPPAPALRAAPAPASEQTIDAKPVDHTLEPGHDPVAMEGEPQALADLRSLIGSGNRAGARAAISKLPKELQKAGADLYSSLAR